MQAKPKLTPHLPSEKALSLLLPRHCPYVRNNPQTYLSPPSLRASVSPYVRSNPQNRCAAHLFSPLPTEVGAGGWGQLYNLITYPLSPLLPYSQQKKQRQKRHLTKKSKKIKKNSLQLKNYGLINYLSYALVAQLDRASDYGSEGCEFEPRRVHQLKNPLAPQEGFYLSQTIKGSNSQNISHFFHLTFFAKNVTFHPNKNTEQP